MFVEIASFERNSKRTVEQNVPELEQIVSTYIDIYFLLIWSDLFIEHII